jgi:hypothetical protein
MIQISKKTVMSLLALVLVLTLTLIATGCNKKNDLKIVNPESISITTKGYALTKDSYLIEAKVLPAEADQGYSVALKEQYTGITLDGNKIVIGEDAVHEAQFFVVVTSTANKSVVAEKKFLVDNPLPVPGIAITNGSLIVDITDGTTSYEVFCDVSPKGTPVTFSIKEEKAGIAVATDGTVTIDPNIDNKSTFIAVVSAQIDGQTYTDEKQFTIVNETSRPISTAAELRALWVDKDTSYANLNNFYHLTNDIDLNNEQWYQFLGYTDENSLKHGYAGTFDGRGYAIKNFKWENAGWNAGFFFNIESEGKVSTLGLYGSMTTAGGCSGAISGYMFGTIENLFVDVDIIQTHATQWSGALYGASKDAANGSKIINCLSVGTVTSTSGKSGLIGSVNYAADTVFTKSFGLQGSVSSIVGETNVQNIVGYAELLSEVTLKTASTYEGWDANVWFIKNGTYPLLRNATFVEPDIPDYPTVVITNTNESKEFDYAQESQRSFAVTCAIEPANSAVVYSLDKEVEGVSIDALTGIVKISQSVNNKAKFVVVITSAENPYAFDKVEFTVTNEIVREIATVEDLMVLSGNIDVLYNNYKLVANIVLVEDFNPIGNGVGSNNLDDGYKGTFDGNGYTISNLNMIKTGWNAGFFWSIASNGVVKSLALEGGEFGVVTIIGGSLAGYLWGTIENCFVDVDVTSNHASQPSGGLVGTTSGDYVIKNTIYVGTAKCSNPEAANGSGLIGSGAKTGIQNSFALSTGVDGVIGAAKVGDENEEDCLKTGEELRMVATYAEWDCENVWYVADGSFPMLRYSGFVIPTEFIEIINEKTTLSYTDGNTSVQMIHNTYPKDQTVVYSLKEAVAGVSITEAGLVTFESTVKNNAKFTVVATVGEGITDEVTFTIVNKTPVQISTVDQLKAISEDLYGHYILVNNIDLGKADWTPIGFATGAGIKDQTYAFHGVLDGNGYTINGLNVKAGQGWNGGFIYIIGTDGIVKNLGLTGSVLSSCGGAFTGNLRGGTLQNCWANVTVTRHAETSSQWVGTLVGAIENGKVINCLAVGQGTGLSTSANGVGLIGSNESFKSVIENCFVLDTSVDAIIGEGRILDSTEPVTSIAKTDAELKLAVTFAGWDTTIWNISDGVIPTLKRGCTVAPSDTIEITNTDTEISYNAETVTVQITCDVIPVDASIEYSLKEAVEGVSIDSVTGIVSIASGVTNNAQFTVVATARTLSDEITFTVKVDTTRYVKTVDDLKAVKDDLVGSYILMNDLDLGNTKWTPIAGDFTGVFDGNGYTIRGLYINGMWNGGLFNKIASGAVVKNLAIKGKVESFCGGALAGYLDGTIENCFIDVAHTMATGKDQFIGAIAGTVGTTAKVKNCISIGEGKSTADQSTTKGAGLIGSGSKNNLENCLILEGSTEGVVGYGRLGDSIEPATTFFKTETELKTAATYVGLDTTIWNIVEGQMATLKNGCTKSAQ